MLEWDWHHVDVSEDGERHPPGERGRPPAVYVKRHVFLTELEHCRVICTVEGWSVVLYPDVPLYVRARLRDGFELTGLLEYGINYLLNRDSLRRAPARERHARG